MELEAIARRHGFEELIRDDKTFTKTHAGVYFKTQPLDTSRRGCRTTGQSSPVTFSLIEFSCLDFRDDYNPTFCYLCSISSHEHEHTKPREESKV